MFRIIRLACILLPWPSWHAAKETPLRHLHHPSDPISGNLYSGKFIRRIKSWKRRSERKSSKQGSTFSSTIQFARCWYFARQNRIVETAQE